jgi:dipeptidyl-peptidase-4
MNNSSKRLLTIMLAFMLLVGLQGLSLGQVIRTAGEESGLEEYTGYEEMLDFLQAVQATSTDMLLTDFGETIEGRVQPMAIFSRPMVTNPAEAMATDKPIVLLAANVHGGERTVREGLLIVIRELATAGSDMNALLDDLVILTIPSINPDGFVRATRGNSRGIDLNRDYIKLEQPAMRNFVQNVLLTWYPHVFLDGHNGGAFPYNICYQGPAHAASNQSLTLLSDREIFPFIGMELEKEGFKAWYYSGGNEEAWRTAPTEPRISINYGGFINCFGLLYESPSQSRPDGAKSARIACRALIQYCALNPEKIKMCVEVARRETVEMGQKAIGDIPVQMRTGPKDYKVSYEIAQGRGEEREIIQVTNADLMMEPIPTKTRPRPFAYILEPRAYKAVEMLRKQKILVEVLQEDTEIDVEAYVATGIRRGNLNDHPAAVTTLTLEDETVKRTQTFPKGSYIIRTGQNLGRLAAYMLEPETEDNVVTWNRMDAILPRIPTIETPARGERAGAQQAASTGQRQITETRQQQQAQQQRAGQQRAAGRGQRAGQGGTRQAVIPIFKLMVPTELPTKILK